jgi:hypothetical protein
MNPQPGPSIADSSQPNAGRIYDFLLGGNHNFEIDRIAAQQLLKALPATPHMARLIRWFLGEAVRRLLDEGFTKFLDFASGLPTVDHIHQIAPETCSVIYSDIDPITVAYAQEIVKSFPKVAFVTGDARRPEDLLSQDVVPRLFGTDRKVAIGFNGICWFVTDEQVGHAMQVLHDWAAPGSALFLCDLDSAARTETRARIEEFYKQVNQPVFTRSRARLTELLGKWKLRAPGFSPLQDWLSIKDKKVLDATEATGSTLIGAIVDKT